MFENTISFANVVNGTGSLVLTDDLEIYTRIGLGLSSAGSDWLEIGRGHAGDVPDDHGGRRGKNSTSEIYIRNMFDAWLGYMADDARAPSPSSGPRVPAGSPAPMGRCKGALSEAISVADFGSTETATR